MKSLCLVMPTRNRSACVAYYLETLLPVLDRYPIEIVVYDSSDNEETREVVEGLSHPSIHYDRYVQHGSVSAIDHKVYTAYLKYCGRADYLWFTSDGAVLQLAQYYDVILQLFEQDYDLIVTDCLDCKEQESREYEDATELFANCFWFMTLLSSGISSSRFAKALTEHFPWDENACNNFWIPCAYFRELLLGQYRVCHYANNRIYNPNPKRTDSFWKEQKNALWQWSTYYVEALDAMPSALDGEQEWVLHSFDANTGLFSLPGLLRLKENRNLTPSKLRDTKEPLSRVTKTPLWLMQLVTYCPITGLLKILRKVVQRIKRKLRGMK